jgi:hypothetical protein
VLSDAEGAVYPRPDRRGTLLGRLSVGAPFGLYAVASAGRGCTRQWVSIGDDRWVCGDDVLLRTDRFRAQPSNSSRVPSRWAFTAGNRPRVYRSLADATAGDPHRGELWEAHWGFAVRGEVRVPPTGSYLQLLDGRWISRHDVYGSDPLTFSGDALERLSYSHGHHRTFGWVVAPGTASWRHLEATRTSPGHRQLRRLQRVHVHATQRYNGAEWSRIDGSQWVRSDRLQVFVPSAPPPEVRGSHERWIDVDRVTQILTAYEGREPVYATLVSTGRTGSETPPGVFRVWGKYLTHTMDNLEDSTAQGRFRLGDVPYVQFYDGDRGLHGAYWHDGFGRARSHGCVNLAPRDAQWLFRFTAGEVPEGWVSVAVPRAEGTVVRVR